MISGDRMKGFSFGGCVYRLAVDARHAGSLAMLASIATGTTRPLTNVDYRHTSNLPQGRALWLRDQISDRGAHWAISADGDTSFSAQDLHTELPLVHGTIAMGIAPVRIGGTDNLCNINISDDDERTSKATDKAAPSHGRRAFAGELKRVLDGDRLIVSGGFGLVVFNLPWFRTYWPLPAPERVAIDTGEDIEFCRSVRERGGQIIALKVRTDHFAFGEKQTR